MKKPMNDKEKLEAARFVLRVICTWATFRGGEALVPAHVEKLVRRTLKKIE